MREILFRGKTSDANKWIEGYLFVSQEGGHYIIDTNNDGDNGIPVRLILVNPETVGQYTGKTDKNKTRVFDGDIIRILNAKQPLEVGVVRWNDDDQCYVVCSTWSERCILTDFRNLGRSKFEVIGNIHSNPELLEVTE